MLKLKTAKSGEIANLHYEGVKYYIEQVLDFYIDFFEIINENKPYTDAQTILYDNSDLESKTITSFVNGLGYEVSKKKIKKASIEDICSNPHEYLNPLFYNANEKAYLLLFFKELKDELKSIIISPPKELISIDNNLKEMFPSISTDDGFYIEPIRRILLLKIFNYKKFSNNTSNGFQKDVHKTEYWERYDLAKALNINTCAYCNRIHTITVIKENGKGVASPSMDHFFDKSKFPLFALSFYNLIPSCTNCNSTLKGQKTFDLDNYLHPYLSGFDDHATFSYVPNDADAADGNSDNLMVYLKPKKGSPIEKQVKGNIELFELDQIYSQHADYVQELIKKKEMSNDRYLDILMNDTYRGLNLSLEEAYRLAFGNYYNEEDFQKRPMAKMIKDLVKELRMI